MQTITLELLRHGPPHNQLLSPLTQYLALCESHSAVTVHVPFEHNQMLYRLRALSYAMGEEPRQFQVRDTALVVSELLAKIPGLTADMNRLQLRQGQDTVTHLRLVLSASELALLPFELAIAPNGVPGEGKPLLLQPQIPLCITREARRLPEDFVEWPEKPRVLFIAATPPGYEMVPTGAHLLALRKALAPWIGTIDTDDAQTRSQQVQRHLSVITNASLEAIEDTCASARYTHIHILAHGHESRDGYDVRFGLALHDPANPQAPADIVDGDRLATALRVPRRGEYGKPSRPAVVTLASCNSGNGGTVAGAGASIAHALHEAGIPLVIASQFPLSFGGSIRMVEVLYQGLLLGEDPRTLLVDLRRQLHTQFPTKHDWASITAYASLSPGFEQQLASAQIRRAKASIDEALRVADEVTRRFSFRTSRKSGTPTSTATAGVDKDTETENLLSSTMEQVSAAKKRLEKLLARYPTERARIGSLLASTEKREAEVHYARRNISRLADEERSQARTDALDALSRARDYYWGAFLANRNDYWPIVQFLSLTALLDASDRPQFQQPNARIETEALWLTAEMHSISDLQHDSRLTRSWALGNLIELYILAPLVADTAIKRPIQELQTKAVARTKELLSAASASGVMFAIFSTRRQVARYLELYLELARTASGLPSAFDRVAPIAEGVFGCLPESEEPEWDY